MLSKDIEEVQEVIVFGIQCLSATSCSGEDFSNSNLASQVETYCKAGENNNGGYYECGAKRTKSK
jgi:hypothetical protein